MLADFALSLLTLWLQLVCLTFIAAVALAVACNWRSIFVWRSTPEQFERLTDVEHPDLAAVRRQAIAEHPAAWVDEPDPYFGFSDDRAAVNRKLADIAARNFDEPF